MPEGAGGDASAAVADDAIRAPAMDDVTTTAATARQSEDAAATLDLLQYIRQQRLLPPALVRRQEAHLQASLLPGEHTAQQDQAAEALAADPLDVFRRAPARARPAEGAAHASPQLTSSDAAAATSNQEEGAAGESDPTQQQQPRRVGVELVPDPRAIDGTFYRTRRVALRDRCYSGRSGADFLVAADTPHGTGAKLFNVLSRLEIFDFVAAAPASRRNLYVAVDPERPIDPYFDIDASGVAATTPAAFTAAKEAILGGLLCDVIVPALQQYFGCDVQRVAAFDASDAAAGKVSFHVHCQMREKRCFRHVREHAAFAITTLRPALTRFANAGGATDGTVQQGQPQPPAEATSATAASALPSSAAIAAALDLGVYTAWRMFRLPFNTKRRGLFRSGAPLLPVLAEAIVTSAPLRQLLAATQTSRSNAADLLSSSELADDPVLVPQPASATAWMLAGLEDADDAPATTTASVDAAKMPDVVRAFELCELALISRFNTPDELSFVTAAPADEPSGHDGELEPLRAGMRRAVTDERVGLLLRLFHLIDPQHYGGGNVGGGTGQAADPQVTRLSRVEFEDNGQIRSYYAMQKQSRWCLKLGRPHKSTHGQLFVTYGSVKYRCYANDCFESCLVIPWNSDTLPIRDALFPPLTVAELRRRYPHQHFASESDGSDDSAVVAMTSTDRAAFTGGSAAWATERDTAATQLQEDTGLDAADALAMAHALDSDDDGAAANENAPAAAPAR